jgi:hypothetical protein
MSATLGLFQNSKTQQHMKHLLLFLSFVAFSASTALAQATRTAKLQEIHRQLPASVGKTLQQAGLDPLAAKPPMTAENNVLQLDSTKTFYAYDPTGSMDSFPLYRTIYDYLTPNTRYELEDWHDGSGWSRLSRTAYRYDEMKRLTEVVAEYFDPGTGLFQPDSRLLVFPRGNSPELIDSFFVYGWAPELSEWHPFVLNYNHFEAGDRLAESTSVFNIFGEALLFKDVYYYDDQGDNHYTETLIVEDGFEFLIGATETEYLNHRPIIIVESTFTGIGFEPIGRREMGYTSFGALEQEREFAWDFESENWLLTNRTSYEYDGQQRLSALTIESYEEEGFFFERTEFDYLEDENLALETAYYKFDALEDWMLDTRKYYYYNSVTATPKVPIARQELRIAPNPAAEWAQLQLMEEAQVQVFDATGQLKRQLRLLPGQAIDLSGLPAGLYFIAAHSATALYNGKVVKL